VADTPPRRRRRPPAEPGAPPTEINLDDISPPKDEPPSLPPKAPGKPHNVIQRKLENFIVGMALPFAAAGDAHCAGILAQRGPIVAEAWANLANESPAAKRILENLLKGGALAGAISTTVVTVVPIAVHHGLPIPDFVSPVIFGLSPKEEKKNNAGEPFVAERVPPSEPPPQPTRSNGGGAPGPAAVSILNRDAGAADPANYPQTGNAAQFRK